MLRDSPKTGSITHSAPTVRTRNYATIVYPESAPPDWMEKLSDAHIPALVSPLHDKDTTADGELKKPHYHVQLLFQSVKSHRQVEAIVAEFGGVGVEVVQDAKAYARYLIHHALLERGMRVDLVLKITTYNRITYVSVEDIVLHPTDESTNDDQ